MGPRLAIPSSKDLAQEAAASSSQLGRKGPLGAAAPRSTDPSGKRTRLGAVSCSPGAGAAFRAAPGNAGFGFGEGLTVVLSEGAMLDTVTTHF